MEPAAPVALLVGYRVPAGWHTRIDLMPLRNVVTRHSESGSEDRGETTRRPWARERAGSALERPDRPASPPPAVRRYRPAAR